MATYRQELASVLILTNYRTETKIVESWMGLEFRRATTDGSIFERYMSPIRLAQIQLMQPKVVVSKACRKIADKDRFDSVTSESLM